MNLCRVRKEQEVVHTEKVRLHRMTVSGKGVEAQKDSSVACIDRRVRGAENVRLVSESCVEDLKSCYAELHLDWIVFAVYFSPKVFMPPTKKSLGVLVYLVYSEIFMVERAHVFNFEVSREVGVEISEATVYAKVIKVSVILLQMGIIIVHLDENSGMRLWAVCSGVKIVTIGKDYSNGDGI